MPVQREITRQVRRLAMSFPVVAITGPRQSGKTTLARMAFPRKRYVSLEDPDELDLARADPRGFLARFPNGAVLDEAQRWPDLLSYLQGIVDSDGRRGLFVVTGSQQFGLLSRVTQSLAGRVGLAHLLPFTLREARATGFDPSTLDRALFAGLYPAVHDRRVAPSRWYANYVQTYVERDVRQLLNVGDLASFRTFLRLCAGRIGQLVNLSSIASDCGVTHNTARSWLSVLEASYVVVLLQPHHRNFSKRVVKTPKLYFVDTGLAAWLLGVRNARQLEAHPMRGPLFESFVVSALYKRAFNAADTPSLYFWRDRAGLEVDVLIDEGSTIRPVEIKAGRTLSADQLRGIQSWLSLAGSAGRAPTLVYGGDEARERSGVRVVGWRDAESI